MSLRRRVEPRNADGLPVVLTDINSTERFMFVGKDLPQRGIEVESKLRYSKDYYNGRKEATIQVFGHTTEPFEVTGTFYSKDIASQIVGFTTTGYQSPNRLKKEVLEAFWLKATLVTINWGTNLHFLGVIQSLTFTEYQHNRVGFRFVFDPIGPVEPRNFTAAETRQFATRQQIAQSIEDALLVVEELKLISAHLRGRVLVSTTRLRNAAGLLFGG